MDFETVGWQLEYKFKRADKTEAILFIDKELAGIVPRPEKYDFERLMRSIKMDGIQNKIKGHRVTKRISAKNATGFTILDGWSRVRAMFELGYSGEQVDAAIDIVDVPEDWDKARLLRIVEAQNFARRHLSQAQKREWMAKEFIRDPAQPPIKLARAMGVSTETARIVRAKLVADKRLPLHVNAATSQKGEAEKRKNIALAVINEPTQLTHTLAKRFRASDNTVKKIRERLLAGETPEIIGAVKDGAAVARASKKTARAVAPKPGPTPPITNLRAAPLDRALLAPLETFDQARFDRVLTDMEDFMLHLGTYHNAQNRRNAERLLMDMKAWQSCCARYVAQEASFQTRLNNELTEKN